jgi:cytochrome c peroxidase
MHKMIRKDRLHFLLYTFLTLLAVVFVVLILFPRNGPTSAPAASIGIQDAQNVNGGRPRVQGSAILPIPAPSPGVLQSGKVLLGEKLFHDSTLSSDGSVSCATCHPLLRISADERKIPRSGADGRMIAVGVRNAPGEYNTPTVYNSVFNFRQFWDGRANTLAEQVSGPLNNPAEMASSWPIAILRVSQNSEYQNAFNSEYGGEISERTITDAIVQFEASLLTPNAPFDRYLNGNSTAISNEAKEGYRLFTDYGCVSCHQGINIGGNFFQRFGVMGNYFADRGTPTKADLARYNITHLEEDRYVFKVPGLRNVAVTAPYFHDGSAATLDQAIELMGRYQLGRELSEKERHHIGAFLESLTGEYRGERLQP